MAREELIVNAPVEAALCCVALLDACVRLNEQSAEAIFELIQVLASRFDCDAQCFAKAFAERYPVL